MVEQWQELADTAPDVSRVLKYLSAGKRDASCLKLQLEQAAHAVFDAEMEAEQMPRRSDLRGKLDEIEAAAETISRLVLDPAVLAAVPQLHQAFGASAGLDVTDVPGAMARLLHLTEKAKRRIRRGRGSVTTAQTFGRISSRLLCARIIVEAWRRLHNHSPSPNNEHAQLACAALWAAAGQKPSPGVRDGSRAEGTSWQRHLRDARNLDKTSDDEAVKRKVEPGSALGSMVVECASAIFRDSCTSLPENT